MKRIYKYNELPEDFKFKPQQELLVSSVQDSLEWRLKYTVVEVLFNVICLANSEQKLFWKLKYDVLASLIEVTEED